MNDDILNFHIISPQAILSRSESFLETLKIIEQSFKFFLKFHKKYQADLIKLSNYYCNSNDEVFSRNSTHSSTSIERTRFPSVKDDNFNRLHLELKSKLKQYDESLKDYVIYFKSEIKSLRKNFENEISLKKLSKMIKIFFRNYKHYTSDAEKDQNNEKFYEEFIKFYDFYSNVCLKLNDYESRKLNLYLNLVKIFNFSNPFDYKSSSSEFNSKNIIENWSNINQIIIRIDSKLIKKSGKISTEILKNKQTPLNQNSGTFNFKSFEINNASMIKIMDKFEKYLNLKD